MRKRFAVLGLPGSLAWFFFSTPPAFTANINVVWTSEVGQFAPFGKPFMSRRVVITGIGLVSPLGNSAERMWEALSTGTSGVRELTSIPVEAFPVKFGAEARDFTGAIESRVTRGSISLA